MKIVYADKLNAASLTAIVSRGYAGNRIFFFEQSSSGRTWSRLLKAAHILKVDPELVDFTMAGLVDERGECQFLKINDDIRRLSFEVCDNEIKGSEFFKQAASIFDADSISAFLSKSVAEKIRNTVIYLHAARHHASRLARTDTPAVFLVEREFWSKRLCRFASGLGLEGADYPAGISKFFYTFCTKVRRHIGNRPCNKPAAKKILSDQRPQAYRRAVRQPCIATWYAGQAITLDLDKRSAVFWFLKTDLLRDKAILYFSRTDVPVSDTETEMLGQAGIECVALNTGARQSEATPMWFPGKRYRHMNYLLTKKLIAALVRTAVHGRFPPLFLISEMVSFLRQYAYWLDFFESHNVKINFGNDDFLKTNIPKNLALRRSGGVSIAYQHANLWISSADLSYSADIVFAFGPAYDHFWKETRSKVAQLIYNGYPTDYSFARTRQHGLSLRKKLEEQGAKFVICFLDENSDDDRLAMVSNDESAGIYKFFIEKVLADPTLGLVCKPGYPRTLRDRLSSISGLLDKAVATKRCVFLDTGTLLTEEYPSEAAQAADICVALLVGGAAGMESSLAGTPTVFLDNRKLYSHQLYRTGKGSVVFDNTEDLYRGIETFRKAPDAVPGFGDLHSWLHGRVAFRDGNAAERMNTYLAWLLEELETGTPREEAIGIANKRFSSQWGTGNIEMLWK